MKEQQPNYKKYHKEYRAWINMKTRCQNQNTSYWHLYGGRGIKVCKRWTRFENFLLDMGKCPNGHSLDRINNNGNYEPSNCRWTTVKTQMRNKRNQHIITIKGISMSLAEAIEKNGLSVKYNTILKRIRRGLLADEALSTPSLGVGRRRWW